MSVCDLSSGRPGWANLKAATYPDGTSAHIDGVILYALNFGITAADVTGALGAGLTVTMVSEGPNEPALGGYQGGANRAIATNEAIDRMGYGRDCACYYVAEDPTRLPLYDWPIVEAYFNGINSIRSPRPVGAYGGLWLVDHLLKGWATYGWVVETWGGVNSKMHLCQKLTGVPPQFAGQIDMDDVLQADYGQMPRPTITPPPGDEVTPADLTAITAAVVAALPKPVPPDPGAISDAVMLALRAQFSGPGHELFDRVTQAVIAAIKQTPSNEPVPPAGP